MHLRRLTMLALERAQARAPVRNATVSLFTQAKGLTNNHAAPLRRFCTSDSERASFYIPLEPLRFNSVGRYTLYDYEDSGTLRSGYYTLLGFLLLITYWAAKKLYYIQERNIFGIIFYGGVLFMMAPRLRRVPITFNSIIKQIDLCKDGKSVVITHGYYWNWAERTYDIRAISKPQQPQNVFEMQAIMAFAFPVGISQDVLYIPRSPEYIKNKEVLPAVLNGRYIDTGDSTDEILIE